MRNSVLRCALLFLMAILPLSSIADTCNYPFPQAVTYPYGIKPNNFTQAEMNAHVQAWFNKWKAKYLTQNNCTGIQWRVQRLETGNGQQNGCYGYATAPNENDTVSEGIGYGMVVLVYMSSATNNTQAQFDGLYAFYRANLDGNGLMDWQRPYCNSGGAATDADEDVAFALLMAYRQWGTSANYNYLNEATNIIGKVLQYEITATNDIRPGDSWDGGNISYFAPYEYRMFGDFIPASKTRWYAVASHTYQTIINYYLNSASTNNAALGIKTGLMPNWCNYDGTTWSPGAWSMDYNSWWWDAIRHAWRIGYDYVLYGTANHANAYEASRRISYFFKTKTGGDASQIKSHYKLDGTETVWTGTPNTYIGAEDSMNLPGPVGAVAVAAMAEGDQAWLNECYYTLVTMNAGTGSGNLTDTGIVWGTDYFCDLLKMQYLLVLTGNMPNPNGNYPTVTPTNTWDPYIPTPTPTATNVPGIFDDFESGALVNLDLPAAQSAFTSVTSATDRPQAGTRSVKIAMAANGWGGFGIDSPYNPLGYGDYTGATAVEFDIYSTANINFFIKIIEAAANGGDSEEYSNRGTQDSAAANGWRHISVPITELTRDSFSPAGDNVRDIQAIQEFFFQIDTGSAATIWIDNIKFTGSFPTPTNTGTPTRTNTPLYTNTFTRTFTSTNTATPTYTNTSTITPGGPTFTYTVTNTSTRTATNTQTFTNTATPTDTPDCQGGPYNVFEDFETGALTNPVTTDTGGGSTIALAINTTTVHTGGYSMRAQTTGTGWSVAEIDSPYTCSGVKDFTGATGLSFWINAPATTGFFIKLTEGINAGDPAGQDWSNRGTGWTATGGWQQVTIALSALTVDGWSPAGDTTLDLNSIKTFVIQFDNPGTKTIYIDDITFTGMPVPTSTQTATRTATPTRTSTFTNTATGTATGTNTASNTPTGTNTATPTYTATSTATRTNTSTATATHTATQTDTATVLIPTSTFTATYTNTAVPPTNTNTATYTATSTYSSTPTATRTATATGTNTATASRTATATHTITDTFTSTETQVPGDPTWTVTHTFSITNTPSRTYTNTATGTETRTETNTATYTATATYSSTSTSTAVDTSTATASETQTRTMTQTGTATRTFTATHTFTSTETQVPGAPTWTATNTFSITNTPSRTYTATYTQTNTQTPVNTATYTFTNVNTATSTYTVPATATFTFTSTHTAVPGASATPTATATEAAVFEIPPDKPVIIFPHPASSKQDLYVQFEITQAAEELSFRIYTVSFRFIREYRKAGGLAPGVNTLTISKEYLNGLGKGTYYYIISLKGKEGFKAKSKIGKLIILE